MRRLKIKGHGVALPKETVSFKGETRYRVSADESQLGLAVTACQNALLAANLKAEDLDCIISASAVGIQPIPCTAALIHEQIAKGTAIPSLDINTTCTSFITALDTMSYLVEAGRYQRILIVSSEIGSRGLNPDQKESYELFSDGAVAFIFESTNHPIGIIGSIQRTWSEGAHDTEIRGGLTALPPDNFTQENRTDFQFDMKGKHVLALTAKKLPQMLTDFLGMQGIKKEEIDFIIPHQASRALPFMMSKLGFKKDKYLNLVPDYGNMVSASVPFTLSYALDKELVNVGDTIALMGTAAGLTTNMLLLKI